MLNVEWERRVHGLFMSVMDLPVGEREAVLERECGSDDRMRREVLALLAEDAGGEGSFGEPLLGARLTARHAYPRADRADAASTDSTGGGPGDRALPERIGRYRILGLLGSGGMGVVFRAEQESPRREVALKTLRPGAASRRILAHFQTEIESLVRLKHPGIAQIYESGTALTAWGPQPYLAMELVEGRPLLEYLRGDQALSVAQKLELVATVCDIVEFAHQNGVIHRDLKPANIMVSADAKPKVLDFGVSRLLDSALGPRSFATATGEIVGTLAYMSPEQLDGRVDTRADVYALGVILFEILAGQPPLDLRTASLGKVAELIRTERPRPLAAYGREFAGDLKTIVAKAMEKDRAERYAGAGALAQDIRHFLRDEPIGARPPTLAYVARKFARRNRAQVLLGLIITAVVLSALVAAVYGLSQAAFEAGQRRQILASAVGTVGRVASTALPKLGTLVGTAEVREKLLSEFQQLNDDLRSVAGGDPTLLAARADLLESLSELARVELRYSDAMSERREALEIRARLHRLTPQDLERSRKLALSHVLVGDVYGQLGDLAASEQWYLDALRLQEQALRSHAEDPGLVDDVMWSHVRLGHTAREMGRPDDARRRFAAALDLIARDTPDGRVPTSSLLVRQEILGQFWMLEETNSEAQAALLDQRLECLRELKVRRPGDRTVRTNLMLASGGLGRMLGAQGSCNLAERILTDAFLAESDSASTAEPDPEWFGARLALQYELARLEFVEGRAEACCRRLTGIIEALAALPNSVASADGLVSARWEVVRLLGQLEPAELQGAVRRAYDGVVAKFEEFEADPDTHGFAAARLSNLLLHPPDGIAPNYLLALDYNLTARSSVRWSELRIVLDRGEIYRQLGDLEEAARWEAVARRLSEAPSAGSVNQ